MWLCALVLRIEDVKIALSATLSVQKMRRRWKGCPQRGCHITRLRFWSHQKARVSAKRSCFLKGLSSCSEVWLAMHWALSSSAILPGRWWALTRRYGLTARGQVSSPVWRFYVPMAGKAWLLAPLRFTWGSCHKFRVTPVPVWGQLWRVGGLGLLGEYTEGGWGSGEHRQRGESNDGLLIQIGGERAREQARGSERMVGWRDCRFVWHQRIIGAETDILKRHYRWLQ